MFLTSKLGFTQGYKNLYPSNTVLHIRNNGSTIYDVKGKTVTANGNTQVSSGVTVFGLSTIAYDGTGDYLSIPTSSDFNFGTGDFTIETHFVSANTINSDRFLISSSGSGGLFFGFRFLSGTVRLGIGRSSIAWDHETVVTISPNTLYYTKVIRISGVVKFYIDTVQIGSNFSNTTSYDLSTTSLTVGSQGTNYYWNGNLFDTRVTKGIARPNIVPNAPFPIY